MNKKPMPVTASVFCLWTGRGHCCLRSTSINRGGTFGAQPFANRRDRSRSPSSNSISQIAGAEVLADALAADEAARAHPPKTPAGIDTPYHEIGVLLHEARVMLGRVAFDLVVHEVRKEVVHSLFVFVFLFALVIGLAGLGVEPFGQ